MYDSFNIPMTVSGLVPILPFFIVLGVDLGIPITVQATVGSIISIITLLSKPPVSLFVDAFPNLRKLVFVAVIFLCGLSFSSMYFIKPFGKKPHFDNAVILPKYQNSASVNSSVESFKDNITTEYLRFDQVLLLLQNDGEPGFFRN